MWYSTKTIPTIVDLQSSSWKGPRFLFGQVLITRITFLHCDEAEIYNE